MVFLNKGSRSKLPGITGIFPFAAISVKLTPKEIKSLSLISCKREALLSKFNAMVEKRAAR